MPTEAKKYTVHEEGFGVLDPDGNGMADFVIADTLNHLAGELEKATAARNSYHASMLDWKAASEKNGAEMAGFQTRAIVAETRLAEAVGALRGLYVDEETGEALGLVDQAGTRVCPFCGSYPHQVGALAGQPTKHSSACERILAILAKHPTTTTHAGETKGEDVEPRDQPSNKPIGQCPKCGTFVYTVEGYCGVCRGAGL